MHRSINYFALDEPDVSFEVGDRGVYTGAAALKTLYADQYGSAPLKGNLLIQYVTTGSIQIAGDQKTAKGMWRCLHVESISPREGDGEPEPVWACGAYAGMKPIKTPSWTSVCNISTNLTIWCLVPQSTSSRRDPNGRYGTYTGSELSR